LQPIANDQPPCSPPCDQHAIEPRPRNATALVRLNEDALEPLHAHLPGEVKQEALDRDDGNRPLHSHFVGLQPPGLVQRYALVLRAARSPQHLNIAARAAKPRDGRR